MYLHLPIPTLVLRKFAKSKIKPYCQEVKASRDWLQKFSQSHELALQRSTLISQELPKHLEEKLPGFYMMCANFLKTGKYPLALVRNMHETSIFFNMVPNKSFAKKSCKLVTVRTSGCETKHVTVVLTIPRVETLYHQWLYSAVKLTALLEMLLFQIASLLSSRKRLG